MKINSITVSMFQTNCYIIETAQKNAVIVDPGGSGNAILSFCEKNGLKPTAILLTHGHYDHIAGATVIKKATNAEVMLNKCDNEFLLSPALLGLDIVDVEEDYFPASADRFIKDGDKIVIDELTFKVLHTPGHTKGSCVYMLDDMLFTGDTLFAGSVGRTDLYGSDGDALLKSLAKLKALDGDYIVFPGHGEETKLGKERITNPFMGTNYDDIF